MTQPAGWYDDPWSPDQYRFWDGNAWTGHASPKYLTPAPPGARSRDLSPDGARLSGWWRRVGARLLDILLVTVLALPVSGYFWYRYLKGSLDFLDERQAAGGDNPFAAPYELPFDVWAWTIPLTLLTAAVGMAYEIWFLRRRGATPGKLVAGIAVRGRLPDTDLSRTVLLRRTGVIYGLVALGVVPVLGVLVSLASLLNYLWPLWDQQRQALHDKAADTLVVRRR